jgi:hypothetical protein
MKPCIRILPVFFIVAALLLAGCEGDNGVEPEDPEDAPGWISQGWAQYSAGNYEESATSFDASVSLAEAAYWSAFEDSVFAAANNDSVALEAAVAEMALQLGYLAEGLNGIGWDMIEILDMGTGVFVFTAAIELNPVYEDAIGGYSFLLQVMEEWHQSNEKITMLLDMDSTWNFEHDQSIDYLDLQLARCSNNFLLGDFEASQTEALELAAVFGYETPGELATLIGMPTFSYNLATIEGRSALLMLIDALEDLI